MDYTQDTHNLLERLSLLHERDNFTLHKQGGEEAILNTYDVFNLARPKAVVWHESVDSEFLSEASKAGQTYSDIIQYYTSPSRNASKVYDSESMKTASVTLSSYLACREYSNHQRDSVLSTRCKNCDVDRRLSLTWDFDSYVMLYEYQKSKIKVDEKMQKYLKYWNALVTSQESGTGYWCEWEGLLHLAPICTHPTV